MIPRLHLARYDARLLNHIDALPQGASVEALQAPILADAKLVRTKPWHTAWMNSKLAKYDASEYKIGRVLNRLDRHGYLFSRMETVSETKRRWEEGGNPHKHPEALRLYFLSRSGQETLRLCRLSRMVE